MSDGTDDTRLDEGPDGHVGHIGRKARRGLTWSFLGSIVAKSGSFAIGLVLARLLSPADFGVYAVALAALTLAINVNDVGIIAACVQWRGRFEEMAPTGATIALISSLFVYGFAWMFAPTFATFSGAPEAAPVIRLLALIVIIDGLSAMRTAALVRRFEQDRLMQANVIGMLANAATAIPLGFAGAGALSFATGQLIGALITNVVVFRMGKLPVVLRFDRHVAGRLMRFGLPLAVSLGIEAVLMNADYVIVGNLLGPAAVGYYLLAFNVSSWAPAFVATAVRYVSIPSFSRLAERGSAAVQLGARRSIPVITATILPVAVTTAILGPQLVDVVYGEKWGPSAVVLQLLSVLMVVRMVTSLTVDILISTGCTTWAAWMNAGWAMALVPALWFGTQLAGIRGTAIAHGIVAVFVALPLAAFSLRRADVRLLPVLPALLRPALGAGVAAAVMASLATIFDSGPLQSLLIAGATGVLTYTLIVVPLPLLRRTSVRILLRHANP